MNTPIFDFLSEYAFSETSRLHMPGSKGMVSLGPEPLDITEIKGADELYEPDGIIAESEANATSLFGSGMTCYSTEGSSHAIRSMVALAKQLYMKNDKQVILAARNVHKAFLYACAIADIDVTWMYSEDDINSVAAGIVTPEQLKENIEVNLKSNTDILAVYITSPNYLGGIADIAGLKKICEEYDLPLLVDNAHGAYLAFLKNSLHPMKLGADMCADSAHKTLPVLTGGAYLHISRNVMERYSLEKQQVKSIMEITGTTSPSYLIMASLDQANKLLSEGLAAEYDRLSEWLENWKNELREKSVPILYGESLKIVIDAYALGMTGGELGDILRAAKIEPEFCDRNYVVCMVTPYNTTEDLNKIKIALMQVKEVKLPAKETELFKLPELKKELSIRQAVFGKQSLIPVEESIGRICGLPVATCPPAVPIAVSGEVITQEAIELFKKYNVKKIYVV